MASIINQHSVNLLRFGFLAAGISYGYSRKQSLTSFVHERNEKYKQQRYEELVEEAKIAYDTFEMTKMAQEAKKDGVKTVDPNSFQYNADEVANWAMAKYDTK